MEKFFVSLKGTFHNGDKVETDNRVFRLHYRFTTPILLLFSLLVTTKQFFGDPISCIAGNDDEIPEKVLSTFCWIHSTFSVQSAWHKEVGVEVPYPGVDKYTPGEDRVYHTYYQWVCFVLLLQATLFYVPRYFWKSFESGRMKNLTVNLKFPVLKKKEEPFKHVDPLVNYLVSTLRHNDAYFALYSLAELLNFINVLGQIFLIDTFLGHSFSEYGIRVISFSDWDESLRFDPMINVFPRMTKCVFHLFGSSGDVQKHDAMCILPINIVNEKIFIFLWFWLVILAVVSAFTLVYRCVLVSSKKLQLQVLRARAKLVPTEWLVTVLKRCKTGDWFVIYLLSKNIDPLMFQDLMSRMTTGLYVGDLLLDVDNLDDNSLTIRQNVRKSAEDSLAVNSNAAKWANDSLDVSPDDDEPVEVSEV